jgi:hypothetical protein
MGRIIGQLAWAILGFIGLFSVVDIGFGPIVICPQCTKGLNLTFGIVIIVIAVAAFITNRSAAAQR